MKLKTHFLKPFAVVFSTVTLLLCSTSQISAALLAYEGFNITAGDLNGQTTGSTTGFTGSETWGVTGGSVNDGFTGNTSGLTYSGLQTSGGSATSFRVGGFNDTTGAAGTLSTSTPLTTISQTELYFSALINADALTGSGTNGLAIGWDHRVSGGNRVGGFQIQGTGDVYSYAAGGSSNTDTSLNLSSGVNLVVVRLTDKTLSGSDEFNLWLNPTVGSPLGVADFTENIGFNGLTAGNASFGFNGFVINGAHNGAQSSIIDELRLGETFSDVAPTAIPEPGSAMLLLAGLGMLWFLRRTRV